MSLDALYPIVTVGGAIFVLWSLWSLCWGVVPFSAKAKRRKETKMVLTAARTFILSYEDLPAYGDGGEFGARMQSLREAWKAGNVEECKSLLAFLDPPKDFAVGREWLDILVVSVSVAMAFRAYFYEPFNIPTGSMQPTLYGNHSESISPQEMTAWDSGPQRWLKWLVTGKTYECFTAPFDGELQFQKTNTGHYDMRVVNPRTGQVGPSMLVPTDVLQPLRLPNGLCSGVPVKAGQVLWKNIQSPSDGVLMFQPRISQGGDHDKTAFVYDMCVACSLSQEAAASAVRLATFAPESLYGRDSGDAPRPDVMVWQELLPNGLYPNAPVRAGQRIWSGYVITGDFLFVNRWLWNFRHPRRGDVMIFNTTGISERNKIARRDYQIAPGTHYIKRMTGTPGERLTFAADGEDAASLLYPRCKLVVNGEHPMAPERIAQIQRREKFSPDAERPYHGYRAAGNVRVGQEFALRDDEYFACGDNSENSLDSRYWGPVPAKNLCGIAGGVFWPFTHRWGAIK